MCKRRTITTIIIALAFAVLITTGCYPEPSKEEQDLKGTIVLNPDNGTSAIVLSGDIGALATLPVPTKDGSFFVGWYDDSGNVYSVSINFRDESIYLRARWKTSTSVNGRISIPEGTGYSFSDFWVKASNGVISQVSSDGTFGLSGLEMGKSYDLYFSCSEPSVATAKSVSYEPAVKYGALLKGFVIPSEEMTDLGVVPMRPTGTIVGTAILDDSENGDNSGIDVFISGTWFTAKTDLDGSFIIQDIPEGQYSITFKKNGYNERTMDDVIIADKDDSSSPIVSLATLSLAEKAKGITGVVHLEGLTDFSSVSVSIPGTSYKAVTNENGQFTIMAEPGSYSGLLYKYDDYTTEMYGSIITVKDDGQCLIPVMDMKAVKAKTVYGKVVLKGVSDCSGVTIKLKGSATELSTLSDTEGNWIMEHVPLGAYEVSLTKENVPSYSFGLTVLPGYNEVGTYTLVPNGASVSGIIMSDHPMQNAEVVLKNKATEEQRSCFSNIDGSFCFSEVEPENDYYLIIHNTGWDTTKISVDGLKILETRDIGSISLEDSIAPIVNYLSIDAGATTAYDNKLFISASVSEDGSGLNKVEVAESSDFLVNYASFERANFYYHCSKGEGTKTLYVKVTDKAGNTSETVTSSIDLVILPTSYSGNLSDGQLHWTVENSPILVTDNIYIPEGKTLVIDAGVDVIIQNNSSINITGFIQVNGTESDRVTISGGGLNISSNMEVTTKDDFFEQKSGSSMSYTDIAVPFIIGDIGFHHCTVNTSFHGDSQNYYHYDVLFEDCSVIGGIGRCFNLYSLGSSLQLSSFSVWNPLIIDSVFEYTTDAQLQELGCVGAGGYDSVAGHYGDVWIDSGSEDFTGFYNSYFKNWRTMECPETCINNTFDSCAQIRFDLYNWFTSGDLRGALTLSGNSFEGTNKITINVRSSHDMSKVALNVTGNNFGNCQFVYSGYKGPSQQYDISQNYFGDTNTQIIYTSEGGKNLAFITDYYDDINLPELIYYPSLQTPIENCGCSITIVTM